MSNGISRIRQAPLTHPSGVSARSQQPDARLVLSLFDKLHTTPKKESPPALIVFEASRG